MCLKDERKETSEHDEYAVGTLIQKSGELLGFVLIELSILVFTVIRAREHNHVVGEVALRRKLCTYMDISLTKMRKPVRL